MSAGLWLDRRVFGSNTIFGSAFWSERLGLPVGCGSVGAWPNRAAISCCLHETGLTKPVSILSKARVTTAPGHHPVALNAAPKKSPWSEITPLSLGHDCAAMPSNAGNRGMTVHGEILTPRSTGASPWRWSTWCRVRCPRRVSDVALSLTARSQVTRPSVKEQTRSTLSSRKTCSHFTKQRTSGVVPFEHESQRDGRRPHDTTFGGWEEAFHILSETGAESMFHARPSSIWSHGCGWSARWYVMEVRTAVDYGKKSRLTDAGSACPHIAMAVVEPCNIFLCVHSGVEIADSSLVTDNKAMQDTAGRNSDHRVFLSHPHVPVRSTVRTSLSPRRYGALHAHSLHALQLRTHLSGEVPPVTTVWGRQHHVCIAPVATMVRCDSCHGKHTACGLLQRSDVVLKESAPRWRRSREGDTFNLRSAEGCQRRDGDAVAPQGF